MTVKINNLGLEAAAKAAMVLSGKRDPVVEEIGKELGIEPKKGEKDDD